VSDGAARIAGFPLMVDFGNNRPERPLYELLKIEETIQTVMTAQELYAKAALVDHRALAAHQTACALIDAEERLKQDRIANERAAKNASSGGSYA
jgi:hypothetical protein